MTPPPGSTPRRQPIAVPRRIGGSAWRSCSRVGQIPSSRVTTRLRASGLSRLTRISAIPNSPSATTAKLIPLATSGMPKVKRETPELISVPTMPKSKPRTIIESAFSREPESTTALTRPTTIKAKYSAAPNRIATLARAGANALKQRSGGSGHERSDSRHRKGQPRLSVSGHLVAIDRRDDGGRLAGELQQNGARRAAMLRP